MSNDNPFSVADLTARYLTDQAEAHELGLGRQDHDGEVLLYQAGPVHTIEPRTAWNEAVEVLPRFFAGQNQQVQPPAFWASLVAVQEPAIAIAFCAANFPQLVRDWQTLLHAENLEKLCPARGAPAPIFVQEWTDPLKSARRFPEALLAVGCLRLARQFDAAIDFVRSMDANVPADWRAAWANEVAALAWHTGDHRQASDAWNQQEPSVPVLFNRGMAALFIGQKKNAEAALAQASASLPDSSGWHHLAELYLTFARMAPS